MVEKILERLARECFGDKQLARPSFKSLATEIQINTWTRKVAAIHQKLAKRSLVLETVNNEAGALVPANMHARKVTPSGRDRCFVPRSDRSHAPKNVRCLRYRGIRLT